MTDRSDISRRDALRTMALASAALAGAPAVLRRRYSLMGQGQGTWSARTIRLVQESPVVDMLCQFKFPDLRLEGTPLPTRWLREPTAFTEADFAIFRDSGVNVLALGGGAPSYETALEFQAEWSGFIASHSDWFTRIDDPRDFQSVRGSGKVGIMLTYQNSEHFRTPADVDTFFGLGQRVSQLTYNFQNRIGAGFLEHNDGGLTVFGHQIVERMQQVGMGVDVAHCADRTTLDTLAAATKPVIVTHAACRALVPGFARCKTDEAIQKLAATGGVMGIGYIRFMIKADAPVTVEHVVDHFDHIIKLVGAEHAGVGSDLDMYGLGMPQQPPGAVGIEGQANFERYHPFYTEDGGVHVDGLNHPRRMFDLTEAFVRRGHSDATIGLLLGGNWVRVLSELWG